MVALVSILIVEDDEPFPIFSRVNLHETRFSFYQIPVPKMKSDAKNLS